MKLEVSSVRRAALILATLAAASPAAAQSGGAAPARRSASDGVYTLPQAERGEATFRSVCAACHTIGDFSGDAFLRRWPTVGSLFDIVSTTMPQDQPGSLSAQQYSELMAYLLSRNNFPAGTVELPREVPELNAIAIVPPRP